MVHLMAKPLAQVTDVQALDALDGTAARVSIRVPATWGGVTVEVSIPRMLTCDRCDGGGCDSCARSGALRAPKDGDVRRITMTLPTTIAPTKIRLPTPFEDPCIEQLFVEIRPGELSDSVRRLSPERALAAPAAAPSPSMLPVMLCVAALIVIGALMAVL